MLFIFRISGPKITNIDETFPEFQQNLRKNKNLLDSIDSDQRQHESTAVREPSLG